MIFICIFMLLYLFSVQCSLFASLPPRVAAQCSLSLLKIHRILQPACVFPRSVYEAWAWTGLF